MYHAFLEQYQTEFYHALFCLQQGALGAVLVYRISIYKLVSPAHMILKLRSFIYLFIYF